MKTTLNHTIAVSCSAALVSCRPSATTALRTVKVHCVACPSTTIPVRHATEIGGQPFLGKVFWIRPCSNA